MLASEATAVLLDPEISATQAIAQHAIPNNIGIVVALKSQGIWVMPHRAKHKSFRIGRSKKPNVWARMLSSYWSITTPEFIHCKSNRRLHIEGRNDCRKHDLVLMLEPLSYSLDENRKLTSEEKRTVVVETARRLSPLILIFSRRNFR